MHLTDQNTGVPVYTHQEKGFSLPQTLTECVIVHESTNDWLALNNLNESQPTLSCIHSVLHTVWSAYSCDFRPHIRPGHSSEPFLTGGAAESDGESVKHASHCAPPRTSSLTATTLLVLSQTINPDARTAWREQIVCKASIASENSLNAIHTHPND